MKKPASAAPATTIGTQAFCDTCPYWTGPSGQQCRRNPPVAGMGFAKVWPQTGPNEWCGEHPARRQEDVVITGKPDHVCESCGVAWGMHKPGCSVGVAERRPARNRKAA